MNSLTSLLATAGAHLKAGQLPSARQLNAQVLTTSPFSVPALLQASYIEGAADNYRLARDYAVRAYNCHAGDIRDVAPLLRRLRIFHLGREARALIDAAEYLDAAAPAVVFDEIATVLNQLGDPEKALEFLERGLKRHPSAAELRLTHAHTLMFVGRLEESEREFDRCVAAYPNVAFAWWMRSRLRRQSDDMNHVDALRRQLAIPMQPPQNRPLLAYALHKELDDLGRVQESIDALDLACKAKRAQIKYSTQETSHLFNKLRGLSISSSHHNIAGPTPIFIVGMHRSGTTLLEQLLDGHPDIRGLGELYDFTSQMRNATDHFCRGVIDTTIVEQSCSLDYAQIGQGYMQSISWRLGPESHFTDKLPSNFLNIGFICQALPNAKILHMVRDPRETGFSALRELFSDTSSLYSYDQTELAAYHGEYRDLMAHWHLQFPGRIHDVSYEELTRDTEHALRRVMAFCHLPYAPSMLSLTANRRSITTASAVQVRQAIEYRDTPKWHAYREYLAPLLAGLQT